MLGQRAHWTSPLKSAIRYIVAAMIPRRGREPSLIRVGSSERLGAFKAHRIAKRGTGPTLAALPLPLHADGGLVPGRPLERLAQIYRSWRENRFWLTNADDLPAAVLHACREEAAEILTITDRCKSRVTRIQARMYLQSFSRKNACTFSGDSFNESKAVFRFTRICAFVLLTC